MPRPRSISARSRCSTPKGRLTIDASTLDPAPENRSDEEYFKVHRDQPDAGLFISRPMLHHGAYAIVLSRRITGADGRFLGVVAGSIRFSYFHDLFGRLQSRPGRHHHRSAPRRHRDHAHAVRPRRDRQESRRDARHQAGAVRTERIVFGGRARRTACRGCSSGATVPDRWSFWSESPGAAFSSLWRTEATRIGAIMLALIVVRARRDAVPGARNRPPRPGRGQARGTGDHRRAHRPEEPAQVRYRDRCRVAARGAPENAARRC